MSNVTIFADKSQIPAHLQTEELDDITKHLVGSGGGKRLSIRGSVFRKIIAGEEVVRNEDRAMNVVIVAAAPHISRTYFEGTYTEDVSQPPRCWSSDGVTPDETVPEPLSDACATCPMNVAGSGQGDTRACRYSQRLAVVVEGDLEGDVLQLSLPAMSIFGKGEKGLMPLQQYARFLAGHKVPVGAIVTEMKFDTDSATPKLTFRPIRPLTEEEYEIAKRQGASQDAQDAITFTAFVSSTSTGDAEADKANTSALEGAITIDDEGEDDAPEQPKEKPKQKPKPKTKKEPDPEPEDVDDDDDVDDDEDDELAELERQLAAKKAALAKAKKAKKKESVGTVKKSKKKSDGDSVEQSAAAIMQAWSDDDDDDDYDD